MPKKPSMLENTTMSTSVEFDKSSTTHGYRSRTTRQNLNDNLQIVPGSIELFPNSDSEDEEDDEYEDIDFDDAKESASLKMGKK